MNDKLEQDLDTLRVVYPKARVERQANGSAWVTIPEFPLPAGWNAPSTEVLFVAPVGYPAARPDCFWAASSLRLASGGMPANANVNNAYGGVEQRLWFSYHPSTWNPNTDTLLTYSKIIRRRFEDAR